MEYKTNSSVNVPYGIDEVWAVFQNPRGLDFDGENMNRTQKTVVEEISPTEWREQLGDGTWSEVKATLDEATKTLTIASQNPNHPGEINSMILSLSEDGEETKIDVETVLETNSKLAIWMIKAVNKSGKMEETTNASVAGAVKRAIENE